MRKFPCGQFLLGRCPHMTSPSSCSLPHDKDLAPFCDLWSKGRCGGCYKRHYYLQNDGQKVVVKRELEDEEYSEQKNKRPKTEDKIKKEHKIKIEAKNKTEIKTKSKAEIKIKTEPNVENEYKIKSEVIVNGKIQYNREFLIKLQEDTLSLQKPRDLMTIQQINNLSSLSLQHLFRFNNKRANLPMTYSSCLNKKRYNRKLLLQLQQDPMSHQKPEDLVTITIQRDDSNKKRKPLTLVFIDDKLFFSRAVTRCVAK